MTTITFKQVQDGLKGIEELLQQFLDEQQAAPRRIEVETGSQGIDLAAGERYAGICLATDGSPTHHLILLPAEVNNVTWQQALYFAKAEGGELPTRQEQSLLFANCKDAFARDWHWSSEQHAEDAGYAWYQNFYYGSQGGHDTDRKLRARAVRRVAI